MRYSDILSLNENFQPVYDIENERKGTWKSFIPHSRFIDLLSNVLISLDSKISKERKSLWIQGEFGTGKSHATAVIEHLLWDDWKDISDYVENLNNQQVKSRLKSFRDKNRVFPVILKGASGITDNKTFALVIERAVKDALRRWNIYISTESDFEKWIRHVRENPLNIDWEKNISDSQDLKRYVRDVNGLIERLERQDLKILNILDDISIQKGFVISSIKVTDWLVDVAKEIEEEGIASHIVLYWDEFTNVLEIEKSPVLLTELQSIAELSVDKNIYLFVVSHRKPTQTQLTENELNKILGRFRTIEYPMEPLTTYHIISGAIKKKDSIRWEDLKRRMLENEVFSRLISRFTLNEGSKDIREAVKNVFPIHPYTAYLATFIAKNIGSTERSIFNFLYDEEYGFLKFIRENPGNNGKYFLTADYLWDFFLREFENSEFNRFGPIIRRYTNYEKDLKGKGEKYLAVFKGLLLLNILTQVTGIRDEGIELVQPSIDNIKSMFLGVIFDSEIEDILEFIDEKGYIRKMPDDKFMVSTADLPPREVSEEALKIKREEISEWLKEYGKEETLVEALTGKPLREIECKIYDAKLEEYKIRTMLKFSKPYSLHIAVLLIRGEEDKIHAKEKINKLSREFKDVIFVLLEEPFGEKTISDIVEYKARAIVSKRHQLEEEYANYISYINRSIDDWLRRVRSGYLTYVLNGIEGRTTITNFSSRINEELSGEIFKYGPENITELRKIATIWDNKKSTKTIEKFLFADTREDIIEKTAKSTQEKYLRSILMDNNNKYVVDENLEFKQEVSANHPLIKISREIENTIKSYEGKEYFHLGSVLRFLTEPPYGLYSNMINSAILALAMRPFIGKLYEANTGKPVGKEIMRDKIINLFEFWQENKNRNLEVRLGTLEEKELVELLGELFKVESIGINRIKWEIREWINSSEYPLWAISTINTNLREVIDKLLWFVRVTDKEISQEDIKELLKLVKNSQLDLEFYLNKDKLKEGFMKWLKGNPKFIIEETDIPDLEKFLKENMQEEIALWEESKVIDKLEIWSVRTEDERKIRDFIRIVEEIFGLNTNKTLNSLKLELRKWINNFGCPLWMFNFGYDEGLAKAFDELSRLLNSDYDINLRDVENLYPTLNEKNTNVQFLLEKNSGKDVFKDWAMRNLMITDLDVEELYRYVVDNAGKDIYRWEKERIKQLLVEAEVFIILRDIFIIPSSKRLAELMYKIGEKINALECPIWVLSDGGKLEKIINIVLKLKNEQFNSLTEILRELKELSREDIKEFQSMLLKPKMYDNFKLWVKRVQNKIEDKFLDRVIDYLYKELGKAVWQWDENIARLKVNNWFIDIYNKEKSRIVYRERISYIQSKIRSTKKDPTSILLQLVEDHPEICDLVEKYL